MKQYFKHLIKESQFLINITNDGWFGKTVGPKQHPLLKYLEQSKNQIP